MFRPNTNCVVYANSGTADVYGMPLPGTVYKERCSVVKLNIKSEKTPVRADTSATRGNANELEADATILLTVKTKANIDDVIALSGSDFIVMAKWPCYSVQGVLDHYQVTCAYWRATP